MVNIPSKSEWQLMLDFNFIRNRLPENTPSRFRTKHTMAFLRLLHPKLVIDDIILSSMDLSSSQVTINDSYYDDKIDHYYNVSGVSLHHLLIPPNHSCAVCGSPSKPVASSIRSILVYASLNKEPKLGSIMRTRCVSKLCRHRGDYG